MRIITGTARGRKLATLEGMHTRPTADRVKQAVFSILQFQMEGSTVLDLFAGSGQLGLEALSRGAAGCVFVENDRAAQRIVEQNIKACGLERQARLECTDALGFLRRQKNGAFHLIFIDPPYGVGLLESAVQEIQRFDILTRGGIMICESKRGAFAPDLTPPYRLLRQYDYGNTSVTFLTRDDT